MAKETKTVQCYPSDDKINAMVERYASFGWELINNQRCQEFTGQTFDSDGSSTSHYSTFNKLTFTREKRRRGTVKLRSWKIGTTV